MGLACCWFQYLSQNNVEIKNKYFYFLIRRAHEIILWHTMSVFSDRKAHYQCREHSYISNSIKVVWMETLIKVLRDECIPRKWMWCLLAVRESALGCCESTTASASKVRKQKFWHFLKMSLLTLLLLQSKLIWNPSCYYLNNQNPPILWGYNFKAL